jgi:hypothetical protein
MKKRYEDSIKWKRWGTKRYTDFAVIHEGRGCEVHVIRHRGGRCDKLLMLIFTAEGVVQRSVDIGKKNLIRALNDLTFQDYKIRWMCGSQPQKVKEKPSPLDKYRSRVEQKKSDTRSELELTRLRVEEMRLQQVIDKQDEAKRERLRNKFPSLKSMDDID